MDSKRIHPIYRAVQQRNEQSIERQGVSGPVSQVARFVKPVFTRRQMLQAATAAAGLALGSGLAISARADDDGSAAPRPIPDTVTPFHLHFNFPGPADAGNEPSTITDFNGFLGVAELEMRGTGINTWTGKTTPYTFDTDWRFMKGAYVGLDGETHRGAFSFI